MEFKITRFERPEAVSFNYDELKAAVTEKAAKYENLVYTEDDVKTAKKDRADLNKLSKVLNDERIRIEREFMQPFNAFKEQINEIRGIIDKPIGMIDVQIKDFDARKKEEKKAAIKEIYENAEHPEWLTFEKAFSESWLKAAYSLSHIERQVIPDFISAILKEAETLENLPEFGFEALEVYKKTLDMSEAVKKAQEMSEIAKAKAAKEAAEAAAKEAKAAEAPTETVETKEEPKEISNSEPAQPADPTEKKAWVNFSALLTRTQALALREFFASNGIEFKAI